MRRLRKGILGEGKVVESEIYSSLLVWDVLSNETLR